MYIWLKAFHIISVIAWMAGLLYLPRLFVYHAGTKAGSEQSETFKIMERRLLKMIMTPAMIAAWVFGIALVVQGGWIKAGWLHAKLALVFVLTAMHGLFSQWARDFEYDRNRRSQKFYRIANELPTLLLIVIVILATVKPL